MQALLFTVALIFAAAASPLVIAADRNAQAAEPRTKVSRAAAEKIALARVPGGKTISGNLERANGRAVWSFDISMPDSKDITEVHIDARTGAVVAVNIETPAQQAQEAAAEKRQAK